MYKKALKMKLRFATSKGKLTTEDLFDLSLTDLNNIAIALDKKLSESPRKSFISDVAPDTSCFHRIRWKFRNADIETGFCS